MCVIADDRAVLGFGGILGGEATGCTHETKNVLIECAYSIHCVRPPRVARPASQRCTLPLRARRRSAFILPGLDLATAMMMEVAGGEPSKRRIAGAPPETRTVVDSRRA